MLPRVSKRTERRVVNVLRDNEQWTCISRNSDDDSDVRVDLESERVREREKESMKERKKVGERLERLSKFDRCERAA